MSPIRQRLALLVTLLPLAGCGPAAIGVGVGSIGGGGGGGDTSSLKVDELRVNGTADVKESILLLTGIAHPDVPEGETANAIVEMQFALRETPGEFKTLTASSTDARVEDLGQGRLRISGISKAPSPPVLLSWSHGDQLTPSAPGILEWSDVRIRAVGNLESAPEDRKKNDVVIQTLVSLGQETGTIAITSVDRPEVPDDPGRAVNERDLVLHGTYTDRYFRKLDDGSFLSDEDRLTIENARLLVPSLTGGDPTPIDVEMVVSIGLPMDDPAGRPSGEEFVFPFEARIPTFGIVDPMTGERRGLIAPGRFDEFVVEFDYSEAPAGGTRATAADGLEVHQVSHSIQVPQIFGEPPAVTSINVNEEAFDPGRPDYLIPIRVEVANQSGYPVNVRIGLAGNFESNSNSGSMPATLLGVPDGEPEPIELVMAAGEQQSLYVYWDVAGDAGFGLDPGRRNEQDMTGFLELLPSLLGREDEASLGHPVDAMGPQASVPLDLNTRLFPRIGQSVVSSGRFQVTTNGAVRDNVIVVSGSNIAGHNGPQDDPNRTHDILFTSDVNCELDPQLPDNPAESGIGVVQSFSALERALGENPVRLLNASQTGCSFGSGITDIASLDLNPDGPDAMIIFGSNTEYVSWSSATGAGVDPEVSAFAQISRQRIGQNFMRQIGNSGTDAVRMRPIPIGDRANRGVLGVQYDRTMTSNFPKYPITDFIVDIAWPNDRDDPGAGWAIDTGRQRFDLPNPVLATDRHFHFRPALVAGEFDGDLQTREVLIASSGSEHPDAPSQGRRSFMHLIRYEPAGSGWRVASQSEFFAELAPPDPIPADTYVSEWRVTRIPGEDGHDHLLLARALRTKIQNSSQASAGDPPRGIELFELTNHGGGMGVLGSPWMPLEGNAQLQIGSRSRTGNGVPSVGLPSTWTNRGGRDDIRMDLADVEVHDVDGDGRPEVFLVLVGTQNFNSEQNNRARLLIMGRTWVRQRALDGDADDDPTLRRPLWRQMVGLDDLEFATPAEGIPESVSGRASLLDFVDVNGDEELDFLFKVQPVASKSADEAPGELWALPSLRGDQPGFGTELNAAGGSIPSAGTAAVFDLDGDGVTDILANGDMFMGAGDAQGTDPRYIPRGLGLVGDRSGLANFLADALVDRRTLEQRAIDVVAWGTRTGRPAAELQRIRYESPPRVFRVNSVQESLDSLLPTSTAAEIHSVHSVLVDRSAAHRDLLFVVTDGSGNDQLRVLRRDANGYSELTRVNNVRFLATVRTSLQASEIPSDPWRDDVPEFVVVAAPETNRLRLLDPARDYQHVQGFSIGTSEDRITGIVTGRFVGDSADDILVMTQRDVSDPRIADAATRVFVLWQRGPLELVPISDQSSRPNRPVVQYYESARSLAVGNAFGESDAESLVVSSRSRRFLQPIATGTADEPTVRMAVSTSLLSGGITVPESATLMDADGDARAEAYFTEPGPTPSVLRLRRGALDR